MSVVMFEKEKKNSVQVRDGVSTCETGEVLGRFGLPPYPLKTKIIVDSTTLSDDVKRLKNNLTDWKAQVEYLEFQLEHEQISDNEFCEQYEKLEKLILDTENFLETV